MGKQLVIFFALFVAIILLLVNVVNVEKRESKFSGDSDVVGEKRARYSMKDGGIVRDYREVIDTGDVRVTLGDDVDIEKFYKISDVEELYKNSKGFLFCLKGIETKDSDPKTLCQFVYVNIDNREDVGRIRSELIDYLWPYGFPNWRPQKISKNVKDGFHDVSDFANLNSIDRLVVDTEFGMNSVIYHFHPKEENGKLFLYHYGHHDDEDIVKDETLRKLIKEGYSVATFFMPLYSENSRPKIKLNLGGETVDLVDHDQFKYVVSDDFTPLSLFLEPIAVALNYLESEYDYNSISMMGISGGGWSTAIYSAVDERIEKNYPIAGIMPHAIHDPGIDYEQLLPGIIDIASTLDLFVLGSYGKGRSQTQFFILEDTCCFKGKWYLENPYGDSVKETLLDLGGGSFEVIVDDTIVGHSISDKVFEDILRIEEQD